MTRLERGTVAGWLVLEALLAQQYQVRHTDWHFVLHTTLGLGLGLVIAAVLRSRHPLRWAFAGDLVSVLPDLLFQLGQLPHRRWMDVFALHITIHLVPQPLLVSLAVFLLASTGWWLTVRGERPRGAQALAGLAVVLLGVALALHHPLPTRLIDYQHLSSTALCH